MSRQQRRRGGRRRREPNSRMQWLMIGGGAIVVVAAVIAILAVALNDGIPGPGDPLDDAGHMLGSADAPVAFVEFSDFQ